MRLIDADSIKYELYYGPNGRAISAVTLEDIEAMDIVDAVEVVRCGDCNWAINNGEKWLHCMMNRDMNGDARAVSEHGFCSYGERKENT